jgi:S1-C subfamily serine protease
MKRIQHHHFLSICSLVVAAGFLVILIQYIGVVYLSPRPANQTTIATVQNQQAPRYESSVGYEDAIMKAVDKVSPAVVSITISKNVPIVEQCPYNPFGNLPPEFQQFFGGGFQMSQPCQKGTKMQEVGGGSGFIISEDGMILTNKHVVEDKEASYTVFTNDGKKYDAKVLARDPVQDIALVKIKATDLPMVTLGNSDGARLGQTVITIGNALAEFRNTVSVGVVSGLARTITADSGAGSERLEGVIQTDAAINPGNSGGPLINLRGEVIGINTAIVSGAQNIGFAIPINNAKRDITSVKNNGKITAAYLGVRYILLTDEIAKRDGLTVSEGALVRGGEDGPGVMKNSPADKAGIEAEDIIVSVGGVPVDASHSLSALIQKYSVGDKVAFKILRGENYLTLNVTLEERK